MMDENFLGDDHDMGAAPLEANESVAGDRVTSSLRKAILAGTFAPGSRIRQEELAAEFGTSRIPVREALRRLETEGLVVLVPNSGAWVAKLDLSECIEIYKMRERLEPLAIAESIANVSPEALARMEQLQSEIESSNDIDEFLRLDREFHLCSYPVVNMPTLIRTIERFWNSTQHYRRAFAKAVGHDGLRMAHYEHRLLLDALRRRDGDAAERTLYGHIRRTRLELESRTDIFPESVAPRSRKKPATKVGSSGSE